MVKQQTVLIVEDEQDIRQLLRYTLTHSHFLVQEAENVRQAKQLMTETHPHLILLDWMLAETSGIEFARYLRSNHNTRHIPIIMLTAKAEENNKVKGFGVGIDDYITKPFSPKELVARVKAILRRGLLVDTDGLLSAHGIHIDTHNQQVMIGHALIKLSTTEYRLLHYFMTHHDRLCKREQILYHVWQDQGDFDERTVDSQVRRLRQLLKPYQLADLIQTVYGLGYRFGTPNT